jgi:hypothetical protein
MFRQLAAVIGIALLVALLNAGGSTIGTFHHVWALMIGGGLGSALAALGLGRVRARHVQSVDDLALDTFEALTE